MAEYTPATSVRNPKTGLMDVEAILPDAQDWTVAAEIDDSSGVPVIVGLSVRRKDHPEVGMWLAGPVKGGGLTTAVLRSVSLSALASQANRHLGSWQLREGASLRLLPDPSRSRQNPPLFYATWAMRYEAAAIGSRSPIAELAASSGMKRSQVRDIIHECRFRKFLTEGQKGQAGGRMTPLAVRTMEGAQEADAE